MTDSGMKNRLEQVPVLYVRGTNYEVGFSIGSAFSSIIQNFFNDWKYISEELLPVYNTAKGKKIYEDTLAVSKIRYPQYVEELRGISDGAGVPFDVCFVLHNMGLMKPEPELNSTNAATPVPEASKLSCTGIISNVDELLLAHNEDAPVEMENRFVIVHAQIVNANGVIVEEFSTLTYPGFLPGYTMGYNKHGFVYCVNTICPAKTFDEGTPIMFLTRAILGAKNVQEVTDILKDTGVGTSDGLSLNFVFANESGGPKAGNIELAPNRGVAKESELSVHWVEKGSSYVHCNRYLRLPHEEVKSYSTTHRHAAIAKLPPPNSTEAIKNILSDQSDFKYPVYRVGSRKPLDDTSEDKWDTAATVATGIFNIDKKTWAIYTKKPSKSEPVVVLPMNF